MPKQSTVRIPPMLGFVLIGSVALALGVWFSLQSTSRQAGAPTGLEATYLPEPRPLPGFDLVDDSGTPFDLDRLQGRWTLLFFGFTHCPDICPTTLLELTAVQETLAAAGAGDRIDTVFVTVDPARDDPERLQAYVRNFNPDFTGVTGPLESIDVLARAVGIAHMRHGEPGTPEYRVDHGTSILLINRDAALQAVFRSPHRAADMADDLLAILRHHRDAA